MRRGFACLLALALMVPAVWAQEFWVKKKYQEWSARECEKMLEDSPWSKTVTVKAVTPMGQSEAVTVIGSGTTAEVVYKAQLRSALPVRQAMVRQSQLNAESRKLSTEEKQAFQQRYTQLLIAEFPDRIIVVVNYSTIPQIQGAFVEYWRSRAAEDWKRDALLITAAGKFAPLEVNQPESNRPNFQLIFPRAVDGKPVIQAGDERFTVEFSQPTIRGVPGQRLHFEFRVKEMVLNGQFVL